MFAWLKADPKKKLRAKYDKLLEQGMHAQRNGNIRLYSELSAEAERVWEEICSLDTQSDAK